MSGLVNTEATLRAYCARILGWANEDAIESALRSIHLSVTYCTALVLLGDTDLVPIAHGLHRRALGDAHPFVVCNPRRSISQSTKVATSGEAAICAALGGSVCVRRRRLPRDFEAMARMLRGSKATTQIIVCAEASYARDPFLLRPGPIVVPPLSARAGELPRIVDEFAHDALRDLAAGVAEFTPRDRAWVIEHSASTLPEIEKGTRRLVAIRQAGSLTQAAARLGMSHVALAQWFGRRGIGKPKP